MKFHRESLAYLREPTGGRDEEGYKTITWGNPIDVLWSVQTKENSLISDKEGKHRSIQEVCYYSGKTIRKGVHEGYGVCLFVKLGDVPTEPKYTIESIIHYPSYTKVRLKEL
jgi:hypothetical protein